METPAIVNEMLQSTEVPMLLTKKKYKVKIAKNTNKNSVIFPTSTMAFLVYPIQDLLPTDDHSTACLDDSGITSIIGFLTVNRNTHLVIISPIFGYLELSLLSNIQKRLLYHSITLLVAHNVSECVDVLDSVASINEGRFATSFQQQLRVLAPSEALICKEACVGY